MLAEGFCYPCEIESCSRCDAEQKCLECGPNYILRRGVCEINITGLNGVKKLNSHPISLADCPSQCESCNETDICSRCKDGYYQKAGFCLNCPQNCLICEEGLCKKCIDGFFLSDKSKCRKIPPEICLEFSGENCVKCAEGFLPEKGVCIQCPKNCKNCEAGICVLCSQGFYLKRGLCETCPFNCKKCDGIKCIQCLLGFELLKDNCFPCPPFCLICENSMCKKCEQNFIKINSVCVCDRPGFLKGVDSVSSNIKCQHCPVNCAMCSVEGICDKCRDNFQLLKNQCLCQPSEGYYFDDNKLECNSCSNGCGKCKSFDSCEMCRTNFVPIEFGTDKIWKCECKTRGGFREYQDSDKIVKCERC